MSADPRARWAEQLAVPVDAPPDAVAAAFLCTLPGDLVPSEEHVSAVNGLTGRALPAGRAGAVEEEVLGAELEAFAARFWSLPPADRRFKWDDLSRRDANAVRLRELEPGLSVTAPMLDDPVAEELAEQFRALFVLSPRARAIRRARWLLAPPGGVGRWQSALAVVQRDAPALVALEPRLRAALDATIDPAGSAADPNWMSASVNVADFSRRVRDHAHADDRDGRGDGPHDGADAQDSRPARPIDWYERENAYEAADRTRARYILLSSPAVFVLLFGCCTLSAVVRQFGRDSGKYSPGPATGSRAASASPYAPESFGPGFSDQEVAEFRRYEREASTGRFVQEPPEYSRWQRSGRPAPRFDQWTERSSITFAPAEIAAFELMERERTAGRVAVRPPAYELWVQAGRPSAAGPTETFVFLDSFLITACQQHDRTGASRPFRYQDWARAGKPSVPGIYPIPGSTTRP